MGKGTSYYQMDCMHELLTSLNFKLDDDKGNWFPIWELMPKEDW